MKKLLLMVMVIFMVGSQVRPNSTGIQAGLIGAAAYIGTSVLVSAMINAIKPNSEPTPFTLKTSIPSLCTAMAGIMAYQGKSIEACYSIISALATTLGTVVYSTTQSKENLIYPDCSNKR
jgi:hypothetical protein